MHHPSARAAYRHAGFTLVELAITIAVVGVVLGSAFQLQRSQREASRQLQAAAQIAAIASSLKAYWEDEHRFPESLEAANLAPRLDPWGRPYAYHPLPARGLENERRDEPLALLNTDFDLYSLGPDGRTDADVNHRYSADDVLRAHDGRYIGLVGARYRR